MVTDFCPGGCLTNRLELVQSAKERVMSHGWEQPPSLSWRARLQIAWQLAMAVSALHQR